MKIINIKYYFMAVCLLLATACETEYDSPLEQFDRGGTVKATLDPDHAFIDLFGDVNTATVEFDLTPFDDNGSNGDLIERLEISMQFIPGDGSAPSDQVDVSTETDLNARVVYQVTDLIDLVDGLTANDLAPGDIFRLSFDVFMTDGRVFGPSNTAAQICAPAGSNGTCTLDITVICPLEADFTGIYEMNDSGGAWGSQVTITNSGGTTRTVSGTWFGFAVTFNFDLVCGEVILNSTFAGVACGGGSVPINVVTPPTPSTYDPTDDSSFEIDLLFTNNCGFTAGTILTYTLSK